MDATVFMEALNELAEQKGIKKEAIIEALKEALHKALEKQISGGHSNDGDIRITINENPAEIKMEYVRKVVEDVQDDYLEISVEDANAGLKKAKYKVGDEFAEEKQVEDMTRVIAATVKSVLRQKISEAEKVSLYELYKDKIGEMITGTVEKCDDRGAMVIIGNNSSLYLTRRDLIGDEMLEMGAPVRLYVSNVTGAEDGKTPMVRVSRSDAGFLRRLFEEEVREIYDGTVIIKSLAREAGVRSKIAVYSNDPNVDSVGCCIGVNGSAIQKIVAQLGNSRDKEKIDVISYSPNDALFIIDALRPATVLKIGLFVNEAGKKCAVAIVPDGQLSLAIGRKGANVRVASKLTDTNIDIKEESLAGDVEIELKTVEQVQEEEKIRIQKEKYDAYLLHIKKEQEQAAALEAMKAEEEAKKAAEKASKAKAKKAEEEKEEEVVIATTIGIEKTKPQRIMDENEFLAKPEPVEKPVAKETVVKTTTSIESLEALLESDKKKESFKATQKTSKRPRKIEEEEVAHEEIKPEEAKPQMAIYTAEELAEMENEEEYIEDDYIDDEDIDYDEFDEYYDDDEK